MKKLKPKATKAKHKPKRKPREWTAYAIAPSRNNNFIYCLYKTKADAERATALVLVYFGLRIIKVKVTEVIE